MSPDSFADLERAPSSKSSPPAVERPPAAAPARVDLGGRASSPSTSPTGPASSSGTSEPAAEPLAEEVDGDWVGRRIGQVRLEALIDRGGMGEVYRGFDESLERPVAVKAIRGDQRLDAEARNRFRREARLLSKLEHPNICRIYDLRATGDEGSDVLILELVEGTKLGEYAQADLSLRQRLDIAEQIASALAAAHELRIVHRDLKPNNVMITKAGQVKVLDFGLARSLERTADGFVDPPTPISGTPRSWPFIDRPPISSAGSGSPSPYPTHSRAPDSSSPTPPSGSSAADPDERAGAERNGSTRRSTNGRPADPPPSQSPWHSSRLELASGSERMVGTLLFMSPEQAFGDTVTEASDLYAFGLILQWLFTGEPPYGQPDDQLDLLKRVLQADTQPVEGLDADLTLLIEELKRHNPEHRPSARDCVRRLRRLVDKPARRRRLRSAASIGAAVVLAVALMLAYGQRQERKRMAAAVELTQEAKDIEWIMRLARSVPAHDLLPQKAEVRRRMRAIEGRLQTGGRLVRGPALYALGRGHLALGEVRPARRDLERAWEEGYRRPEVAFALGRTLGHAYRDGQAEDATCRDRAWCDLRQRWLESRFLAPAARFMRSGAVPGEGMAAFGTAALAYFEGRLDEAARNLTQAPGAAWLHEAPQLAGDVELALARRLEAATGSEEARSGALARDSRARLLADAERARVRARAAYLRSREIGSSDPRAHLGYCRFLLDSGRRQVVSGEDPTTALREAGDACRLARRVDPEFVEPLLGLAQARLLMAEHASRELPLDAESDGVALPDARRLLESELQPALEWLRMAEALDADLPSIARLQARAHGSWARLLARAGGDPEQAATTAMRHAGRAAELDPEDPGSLHERVASGVALARWQAAAGHDPRRVATEVIAALRQVLRTHREFARGHAELARAYLLRAREEASRGQGVDEVLAAARAALDRALELDPEDSVATSLAREIDDPSAAGSSTVEQPEADPTAGGSPGPSETAASEVGVV